MLKVRSIRTRLIIYFLAVILPVMLVVSFVLYNWLRLYYYEHQEDMLVRGGTIAAEFVRGLIVDEVDQPRLISLAENVSRQSQVSTRVIIIDRQKVVIGDSLRVGSRIGEILDREEVEKALQGEITRSVQQSEESDYRIMQVAVPVWREPGNYTLPPVGVVFLSTSLQEVYDILSDVRMVLFWATVIAVILVSGASFLLARKFSDPLGLLTVAAQHMAEGKLEQQIEIDQKDEIGRLADQFNIMADRINYMTRNLKAFAANVSHELRTPLTTISLLVQSLKEHDMDSDQRADFIEDIHQQTERLINLVTDLLELTKLENTNAREKGKQFSLRNTLLELVDQMSVHFVKANVSFSYDIPLAVLMVSGSPGQIRSVFYNLLDNALKYNNAGGRVMLRAWEEEETIEVKVQDTGKGIPENEKEFIFERFYRLDHARARVEGGMGLGLAIVKEIVAVHGGEIRVESSEGDGSVFHVILPKANVKKTIKPNQ